MLNCTNFITTTSLAAVFGSFFKSKAKASNLSNTSNSYQQDYTTGLFEKFKTQLAYREKQGCVLDKFSWGTYQRVNIIINPKTSVESTLQIINKEDGGYAATLHHQHTSDKGKMFSHLHFAPEVHQLNSDVELPETHLYHLSQMFSVVVG